MAKGLAIIVHATYDGALADFIGEMPVDATQWHMELPIGKEGRTCWHCGEPCAFIEFNFEASLHPGVCTDAKWDEYEEALRKTVGEPRDV